MGVCSDFCCFFFDEDSCSCYYSSIFGQYTWEFRCFRSCLLLSNDDCFGVPYLWNLVDLSPHRFIQYSNWCYGAGSPRCSWNRSWLEKVWSLGTSGRGYIWGFVLLLWPFHMESDSSIVDDTGYIERQFWRCIFTFFRMDFCMIWCHPSSYIFVANSYVRF